MVAVCRAELTHIEPGDPRTSADQRVVTMAARVDSTNRVITSESDAHVAREVLDELQGPDGVLRVEHAGRIAEPIPPEVGRVLQQVLDVMAHGGTVTISSTPAELTTSSAAAILGISRPTLLKMVRADEIPSHQVGTHTRFRAEDVHAERRARRERERAAFAELRSLEDED